MQPLSGNHRPDLLKADEHVSCTAPATENASLQILFKRPTPAIIWKCYKTLTFSSLLPRSTIPCACHAKRYLNVQKWSEPFVFFHISTSKCASRHNGVHFFDISTSKSGPNRWCFSHFDFEMCFAPQRRALFRHLNFQKWSENGVFVHFDFEMCFAPQRGAIFHLSSGQLAPRAQL